MKASERWIIEKLGSHEPGLATWHIAAAALAKRYAPEVARIDAAEARLSACSQKANLSASALLREPTKMSWEWYPKVIEAAADVAEGIDRRSATNLPDSQVCERCGHLYLGDFDRRASAGEPTDAGRVAFDERVFIDGWNAGTFSIRELASVMARLAYAKGATNAEIYDAAKIGVRDRERAEGGEGA